jgi:hypothetical protein
VAQESRERRLPSVGELRRQLEKLESERREENESAVIYDWTETSAPFRDDSRASSRSALIQLNHSADAMRCAWTFKRAGGENEEPIRALLDTKGSEWIRVPEGEWTLQLRAAEPGGEPVDFRPQSISIRGGRAYRLGFGERESALIKQRQRALRERERGQAQQEGSVELEPPAR